MLYIIIIDKLIRILNIRILRLEETYINNEIINYIN